MRNIDLEIITRAVKELSIEANTVANCDLKDALSLSIEKEVSPVGKAVLGQLLKNQNIAKAENLPICQDTGFTVVYLEIGMDVSFTGGIIQDAVDQGVREGYIEGCLRKSIIKNPLTSPVNTKDNTPAIVHIELIPGDKVKVSLMPKGGGAENMSRIKMMKPSDGVEVVRDFILETVKRGGANPCPPIIVGVGVGGTFDYVAYLAKKSLFRKIGERNSDPEIALLETSWLLEVNKLGIGPAGLGGKVTALELFVEVFPRHIATFPVAVNIQCNAARVKTRII
ncbi:MAG: fumarate hydratase [Spirochaetia bacterium]|jgi:fumarate hydratase subunit alpha|nr:fumarate hydratase [Spirochaetia bacterium]